MAGEYVRGVFVLYVCEDWLESLLLLQMVSEDIRVEQFVQALGQPIRCQFPKEIRHRARLLVITREQGFLGLAAADLISIYVHVPAEDHRMSHTKKEPLRTSVVNDFTCASPRGNEAVLTPTENRASFAD